MNDKFSCYIIGSESHLVRCAEILLENSHQICGIISTEKLIIDWARKKDIPHIKPGPDLTSVLAQEPFDYFFSIINDFIIPDEILALPRRGAINFHDGPLPRYAGLYVTSWAIINQEDSFGITWHSMSSGVDTGDILKQRCVDIVKSDTALTLNAKCYEAGIAAFAELADELAGGHVQLRKQNMAERTYYAKCKRPPAACTISWNRPADQVSALIRALDFGSSTTYTNPIGLPKLVTGNEIFIVPEIEVLNVNSEFEPGTITAIEDNFLIVTTASNEVIFRKILTINGQLLSIAEFVTRTGVFEGYKFHDFDSDISNRLTNLDSEICRHEEFWLNRLAKLKSVELPYSDHNNDQADPAQYATISIPVLDGINNLRALHHDNANRNILIVAVFAAYLARITDNFNFNLWFIHSELKQELAGCEQFYSPCVPLCIKFEPSDGFDAFLKMLQAELERAKKHKTYSCDIFLRHPELHSIREYGDQLTLPIIMEVVERFDDYTPLPGSELTVLLSEDGTESRWVYDTAVLEKESIAVMQRQFTTFLHNIVANGSSPVNKTSLLTEEEYNRIAIDWNNTSVKYPEDMLIHKLFEAQAKKTPDAIAVIFEDRQLTYRELNRRANQLAHYLRSIGVGPDVLVGISVERSIEMLTGLYGILKAGGAYVPVDPAYPSERIAYMLDNAQVPVLLTHSKLLDKLPTSDIKVICLDTEWDNLISGQDMKAPGCNVTLENLAYTIYTSGSTGKPKGVMNTHQGILNRLLWMQEAYELTASDRVLQKTPFSFDVSVWEFFWPLMSGACLVVARPGGHRDNDYLVQIIKSQQITVLHFVPSMLQLFLDAKDVEECRSLRQVICSGEALSPDLQNRFFDKLDVRLDNLYGPTEAAVDVTCWECRRDSELRSVPIGRPIANTQLYILDRYMHPVPVGVSGELHIGGVQVARGYVNQPDLTANKFIPDPFSSDPKARLYKTGDLCRYLPDGNIEYLGRLDHQVKIRGFRIELGEIESTLDQHPAVCQSVVSARDDETGNSRLMAYVVPDQKNAGTIKKLLHLHHRDNPEQWKPYELPNGMMIAHLNRNETEFLYKEIFEGRSYLKHGVTLNAGDCVFDVGANIGLFSLYIAANYSNLDIYAFEPVPPVFKKLKINADLYSTKITPLQYGLSDRSGSETFTYYPHASIMSGRCADYEKDMNAVKSYLNSPDAFDGQVSNLSGTMIDDLLEERLKSKEIKCELKTVSNVIREHGIDQIDLLKIDVEKSELDVLNGILPEDWVKIRQIVIEVHDSNGLLTQLLHILEKQGYNLKVEQESLLRESNLYNIYATRASEQKNHQRSVNSSLSLYPNQSWIKPSQLIDDMRQFLRNRLPDYMIPSAFVLMESLPLTPNGKVDRQALPAPEGERQLQEAYAAPQNKLEKMIAGIWRELLHVEKIGIHDNFFDLGGHSLLIAQVHSRLHEVVEKELSITDMFRYPTIEKLNEFLTQEQNEELFLEKIHDRARKQKEALNRQRQLINKRVNTHG